jgi:hypothetical protein
MASSIICASALFAAAVAAPTFKENDKVLATFGAGQPTTYKW